MMKRTTIREIRGSFGRFFAILAIIALGVGFFSGIKITKRDMVHTVNGYLKEENFYDLHLLSTLGFEDADVEALAQEEDVKYVEGVCIFDALYTGIGDSELALKTYTLPENVNGIRLVSGRMPENESECVIDSQVSDSLDLGTVIRLSSANESDTKDAFAEKEYTIVGTVDSSYYLNFERGTTSIGNGKLSGFLYVEPEALDCDYYTDIFICFQQDYDSYTDEYEDYIAEKTEEWETLCQERADIRYETLVSDAEDELADAEKELEEQKADAEEQLQEVEDTLTDASAQLADGRNSLNEAWDTLESKEAELTAQEEQLTAQEAELIAQEGQLTAQEEQMEAALGQLTQEQQALLQTMMESLQAAYTEEQAALEEQWAAVSGMDQMLSLAQGQLKLQEARTALESGKAAIESGKTAIESGKAELQDARSQLLAQEAELTEAEDEAAEGWQEYEDSRQEYEDQIADAEDAIEEARQEIEDIEAPDTYVLDRNTNVGYACFENDSDIVDAIAKVFPVFFILVAALVCMTTMNRMVEEQRTQIGVLKALGYSERTIMGKFMAYSGSAALIGCVIGYAVGTIVFPKVIWYAYGMMYQALPLDYVFSWPLALIALAVSILCSIGTTWFSCRYELEETAASLMRGKAPKAGKRVFLERIPFIWKRLKFLHKVSVRNIFRYKKRFFMMIIGISGCTALVLTGFGIEDSIAGFADQQYEEIQIADGTVGLKQDKVAAESADSLNALTEKLDEVAESYTYVSETSWDMLSDENVKSVTLTILENPEEIGTYMNLCTEAGEMLEYPDAGQALINNGLADRYHIQVGDRIIVRNDEMQEIEVTISGIFKNHVYNYVLISPETYSDQMGTEPEYKTLYIRYQEGTDVHEAAAELLQESAVTSVTLYADTAERMDTMMNSLDYVVLLVIACAAGLAFIVLYNLMNINITERIREIATIKVLGFFRNETAAYVFRENMALTGIGSVVGLGLGVLLHQFVMARIQVDMVSFSAYIRPISYLYSILLTFAFYGIVDRVMAIRLDKIDMAESLKSVE